MEDSATELPCAEKISFDTQKDAQATATTAKYRYGGSVKSYRCSHCDLWHLARN